MAPTKAANPHILSRKPWNYPVYVTASDQALGIAYPGIDYQASKPTHTNPQWALKKGGVNGQQDDDGAASSRVSMLNQTYRGSTARAPPFRTRTQEDQVHWRALAQLD